jgi:hypothetical protein
LRSVNNFRFSMNLKQKFTIEQHKARVLKFYSFFLIDL